MNILVSGGTGLIGTHLCSALLGEGHNIAVLTRNPLQKTNPSHTSRLNWVAWSHLRDYCRNHSIEAVIHLAGEPLLPGRWTISKKERLRVSRIQTLETMGQILKETSQHPTLILSASAVGFYGNCGDTPLTENEPAGADFLARLCVDWEQMTQKTLGSLFPDCRTASLRFGIILDKSKGALANLLPIFRLGLGARIGSGRQWMSWIHHEDAVAAILFVLKQPTLHGSLNITSPEPITNAVFTRALGEALHRPTPSRLPTPLLRIALGEAAAPLLDSQRALPRRLEAAGFRFRFPELRAALENILN